jgi:RNA polymerase sigma-70 factor (ECF subfamily)
MGPNLNERSASHKFHQFIWPHRSVVLRLAQILTGNAAEAEDLAQETLLKAFKAILTLTDGSNPKAWLMRILRNARIDRLRAARPSAGHLSLDELELDPPDNRPEAPDVHPGLHDPQEVLNAFSDQQMILALQDLPEDIRWTLLLVDVEGMDHKDAAELLDVPLGTIKSRTHRGRAMLRKTLLPLARQMRLVNE